VEAIIEYYTYIICRDIWFGRAIINSCVKLSYQMAQGVIDTFESSGQVSPDFKDVCIHGDHSPSSIAEDIILLHTLAKKLRKQRYSNGALRLDNSKVMVKLSDGEPEDFGLYQTGSANHLVEEFMLAANISAAKLISDSYPDRSLLRMHPEPNLEKLINTSNLFATWMPDAPKICTDSAGSVQESLKELSLFYQDTPEVMEAITFLCTKPMQMAQYFNTGDIEERTLWRHYALSIPLYTHFTSPIRRYPDIIVHRLILGALEKKSKPKLGAVSVSEVAEHANERKNASKVIQERVTNLYLVKLLEKSPRVAFAVVSGLGGPKYFDVYIPEIGVDIRINVNEMYIRDIDRVQTKWIPDKK
jgi:DIS3-like exonuclease 2